MANWAIECDALAKHYGEIVAVAGIDLRVAAGTIAALLGPNGAGKTTTIAMLTTLTAPSSGSARVAGFDLIGEAAKVRGAIGVTFQEIVLDPDLSGREALDIHGQLYRLSKAERQRRIAQLVELVQLEAAIDRRVRTYSGGMKRRLELARGLLTTPQILFLDEPTQGLDPQNRVGVWEYLRELNRRDGLTVLLTTHYMEEAEALASQVGIIDQGRLVAEGSPAALIGALGGEVIHLRGGGLGNGLSAALAALPFVERVEPGATEAELRITVDHGSRRLGEIIRQINALGGEVYDVSVARPSLADVFLHHTGRALRDETG